MSKKRANKSKRRREPQRSGSSSTPPPRLKLVPAPSSDLPDEKTSGIRFLHEHVGGAALAVGAEASGSSGPISSPPDSVEDIEEEARFFHEGRVHTPHAFAVSEEHDDLLVEPAKPSPKMSPAARARRAKFSKYVKGAMVAATAILALAGIRSVMGRADRIPHSYAAAASPPETPAPLAIQPMAPVEAPAIAPPSPPPAVAAPAPPATVATTGAQVPVETPRVDEPKVDPKTPAAAMVAPAPSPAAPAPAPAAAAGPVDAKAAAHEKAVARTLLERGKAAGAIEAGERSVALDPTDGEAWLILGAAYQEKGNVKDARRAFQSCLKQGKRGPVAECRAMLQQ